MPRQGLGDEHALLAAVVANQADDTPKLVYADWLEEHGDKRAQFLRAYVQASQTMNLADFPKTKGLPEEWLELIGFRLLEKFAAAKEPELKEPVLRLARPALRMKQGAAGGRGITVGASKIGGHPDLPPGFRWPQGQECRATYNDETDGVEELAGFVAQVNFTEIAHTQAARVLPRTGLLSFFCFQDIENDNPDVVGVKAAFFPDPLKLVRTKPPGKLTEGNGIIPARRLTFAETLDLPERHSGPWEGELPPKQHWDRDDVLDYFRSLNFENFLGYARSTTGGDPTQSKQHRHLILLTNTVGCRLHIQIHQDDLAACNFDKITLSWVDFD